MHQLHRVSLPLLAFGWASLALAHGWNRLRHGGGGLPWVLNVLWLSTWVMVASTIIVGLEEGLVGHEDEAGGINWPHLVQQGVTGSFLALLAAQVGLAAGWWRLDVVGRAAQPVPIRGRQTRRALGSLALIAVGVALAAMGSYLIVQFGGVVL